MKERCNLENSDPNNVSWPSISPTDQRFFLAGALALTLANIPANVELVEAQASQDVSINQPQTAARSAPILPKLIKRVRQWLFWSMNGGAWMTISKPWAKIYEQGDFVRLPLTFLTGRLPWIVMKLKSKPKPEPIKSDRRQFFRACYGYHRKEGLLPTLYTYRKISFWLPQR